MTYIVAGGILGLIAGAVIGGNVGYKIGTLATWSLVTHKLRQSERNQTQAT